MIKDVTFEQTIYSDIPAKFEAGTPAIAQAVGLGAALECVMSVGLERIEAYEHTLTKYATIRLNEVLGLRMMGNADGKISVLHGPGSEEYDISHTI
jgi:cysteine desulfurase/selenocysteine lyase